MGKLVIEEGRAASMIPLVAKSIPPLSCETGEAPSRLMRLLDQARKRKVTFVSGAEGYGKTTLLARWYKKLTSEGLGTVWFACDENDADPACFWMNFCYAVGSGLKDAGVPSYEKLVSMPRVQSVYTLANSLCLAAIEQGGIYLIVERLEMLDDSESQDLLALLASSLSDDVHLVFSSRKVYSKHHFKGMLTAGVPLVVTTRELALTKEELAADLKSRVHVSLDEKCVELAYEKTRGWRFAVNALVDRINALGDPCRVIEAFSGMDPQLREFFEYEVFEFLPQNLKKFLVATSFLGLLNARLCSYMLDRDDAPEALDELLVRNAFLEPLDAGGLWFERHPLFSEWLIEAKGSLLSVVEKRRLNGRAAHWTLQHGLKVAAAKHQIIANEREDIFELAACAFPEKTMQEIIDLTRFPETPDEEKLDVCFMVMAAWAYAYAVDGYNMLEWAQRLRGRLGDAMSEDVRLSLEVLEVKRLCLQCEFDEGLKRAAEVAPLLKEKEHLSLRIVLANCRAEAFDHQGLYEQGMKEHKAFATLVVSKPFIFLGAINQYEMAYTYYMLGQLDKASQSCRTIAANTVDDHPVRGAVFALEVMMDVMRGKYRAEDTRLEEARQLVSKKRNVDMFLDWCIARAWSYVALGELDAADEVLAEAMNLVRLGSSAIPRGTSVLPFQSKALIGLLRGDEKSALEAYLDFDRTGVPETAYAKLVREYVELVCSGGEENLEGTLADLVERAEAGGFRVLVLDLTIDLAMLRYQQGQRAGATRLLHEVLEYAVKEEVLSPFIWRAEKIRPLLISYVTSIKADYSRRMFVQRLLKRAEFATGREDEALGLVGLTRREREILELAMEGLTRQEIAAELCVGDSTVKSHLSHMYSKLGVSRYKDLLAMASDLGL